MATTFIQAVNDILTETNEVELSVSNFASAVGIHKYVKNAVNRAYMELCAEEEEWPFLAVDSSNVNDPMASNTFVETERGTRFYLLKPGSTSVGTDYAKIDWNSFYITNEGVEGVARPCLHDNLQYISYDHWNQKYQADENKIEVYEPLYSTINTPGYYGSPYYNSNYYGSAFYSQTTQESADVGELPVPTMGKPERVFKSKDERFLGLSPIPNGKFRVHFTAWVQPNKLDSYSDLISVPDMYMPVLLHRARYYVHFFKKDYQEATLADKAYREGLRTMRRGLMGRTPDSMRDDWYRRR